MGDAPTLTAGLARNFFAQRPRIGAWVLVDDEEVR